MTKAAGRLLQGPVLQADTAVLAVHPAHPH